MNNIVYILHGLGADSHSNWFAWLKQELKDKGYIVAVPDLPCSANPKLDEWLDALKSTVGQYGEGIIIGHSLGGLLAIQYLLHGGKSPKVILAATPFTKVAVAPELDEFFPNKDKLKDLHNLKFVPSSSADQLIELVTDKSPAKTEFVIIQSDNDPLVYEKDAEKWAKELKGELVILPGLGHFTIPEFPEILPYLN
jgi:predicted alpha/beta hydrolase family esterase